ncbi:hypothetical protein LCGC14_1882680 [marine sediment metagenome]|uniref:Uncharacterized protein n=1 Tax=marine sediment metagenome TaxID=412755 RepID=A0A0F9J057_9ZZZZ
MLTYTQPATDTIRRAVEAGSTGLPVTMVVLTGVMAILTVVMVILTVYVCRYAKRTLKATQESLDYFAKPLVGLKPEPGTSQEFPAHEPDSDQRIAGGLLQLMNESAMPIRIDKKEDVCVCKLEDRSSASSASVNVRRKRLAVQDVPRWSWPLSLHRMLRIPVVFSLQRGKTLPQEDMTIVVEVSVSYTYRGRRFPLKQEFSYTLQPPEQWHPQQQDE